LKTLDKDKCTTLFCHTVRDKEKKFNYNIGTRIHGSSYIPPQYQGHMKCITDLDGVKSADDAPDTSYYQWVSFVLLIQAGVNVIKTFFFRVTHA
jgi:hypothetical protein